MSGDRRGGFHVPERQDGAAKRTSGPINERGCILRAQDPAIID